MIITFQEKDSQKYEVDNVDTDEIFEDIKADILNILKKHKSDIDLITSVFALGCIFNELQQSLSNRYGADKVIDIINAKPIVGDLNDTN